MEFFRKGFDPPLFLEAMEPVGHNSILVTKRGKMNLPKTPQMAIFNIKPLGKVLKSTQNYHFFFKFHDFES